nr:alpha-1,3-mannosyl-glycoprotein 4-beta-N-acetylglucosaminyltransferase A isoform X1 [Nothobranchius furzeri]
MRFKPFKCGFLLVLAGFVSLSWIRSVPGDGVPDLKTLYKRLLVAEELGGQVSKDLSSILGELVNMSRAANISNPFTNFSNNTICREKQLRGNSSQHTFPQANIYLYMPHLRQHPDSLVPNVVLGKARRGVSMVLGIPTVKRQKQSYLLNTLSSLLSSLSSSQSLDLLIIVFVAESDSDYVGRVARIIVERFPKEVESGLIEVISPSQHYYPNFNTLKETFGDSKNRVKWRTKQNLDYSFLMLYAQDRGTYYVQLEDDIVAKAGYYSDMKTFTTQTASDEWLYLEFSQLGFIGKMFKTHDLPMIAEFFLMFHKDKPIDWLLDHLLWVKVCNPEKDNKDCEQQKNRLKQRYKPSLFQHVGLHSSLPGKVQHLKDKDFDKQPLFRPHQNPPAELSSSLKHYQQHSLSRLYQGEDFLWALTPVKGDYILFVFHQPIHVKGFLFRTGNIKTNGDKLYNATVEVLPSNTTAKTQMVSSSSSKYRESDDGFIIVGVFENGETEGRIEEQLQPVSALRLVVHSNSDFWALLNEVFIET